MDRASIQICACGAGPHLSDVAELRSRGVPVAHQHTTWPLHDRRRRWYWCRAAAPDDRLLTGFAIEVAASRGLPGTGIGRAERLGRQLHDGHHALVARMLNEAARRIPRLQRLDIQVFDEDVSRRASLVAAIVSEGAINDPAPRQYTETLRANLAGTEADLLRALPYSTRRKIQKLRDEPRVRIEPILDALYAPRLEQLHQWAFQRTGGNAPDYHFEDVLADARHGAESTLIGVFLEGRDPPSDLIAFGWGRCNGDHAMYEAGGSEHAEELAQVSAGVGVMWELLLWAQARRVAWFDLGGVIPNSMPATHPLHGIRQFKHGFSSDKVLVGQELSITQATLLARLTTFARRSMTTRPSQVPQQ